MVYSGAADAKFSFASQAGTASGRLGFYDQRITVRADAYTYCRLRGLYHTSTAFDCFEDLHTTNMCIDLLTYRGSDGFSIRRFSAICIDHSQEFVS